MKLIINKNIALSVILGIVAVLIIGKITPVYVDPVIKLVISKNRVHIANIKQERDIEFTREVMIDEINLVDKSRFRHPRLGEIGYADQFFVDIEKEFTVKKSGQYQFNIGSDDGFTASIDDQFLCEFTGDRPLVIDSCPVNLTAGKHKFKLSYFQGFGNAGLSVEYIKTGSDKAYFFGDSSKFMDFD